MPLSDRILPMEIVCEPVIFPVDVLPIEHALLDKLTSSRLLSLVAETSLSVNILSSDEEGIKLPPTDRGKNGVEWDGFKTDDSSFLCGTG